MSTQLTLHKNTDDGDKVEDLPTVLLFDVIVHSKTLIYREKESTTTFWAFTPSSLNHGDYECYRCDYVGNKLRTVPTFDKDEMPLFIIQEPDSSDNAAVDFTNWLWVAGLQL